jgi:O-antigen ligase
MEARRPQALDLGLFALVVASPLAFTPFTVEPFGDPKLSLLALGGLLSWLAAAPVDRRLARGVGAFLAVGLIAALAGVDPLRSLTDDASGNGFGLVPLGCSAYLLVVGTSLSERHAEKVRVWLGWTGFAVAVVLVLNRFVPGVFGEVAGASLSGSTLGNPLFASAFVAAAMPGVALDPDRARRTRLARLATMAFGLGVAGERSSFLLPLVAIVIACWRAREPLWRGATLVVWVVVFLLAAGPLSALAPERPEGSGVGQFAASATDADRFEVWGVTRRAIEDRPLLGWGPDQTKSAYIRSATPQELRDAGRGWADAHDVVLEVAVTSGVLGLLAFLVVALGAARRAFRAPPRLGWAFGAAASLAAYHAVEPLNLVLTPLLFLLAGTAGGGGLVRTGAAGGRRRRPRPSTGALLGVALAVSLVHLAASALEHWGDAYSEPWAYRAALRLEPWRITAAEDLAIRLAIDGRSGDEDAADEARRVIADAVSDHPWDPDVRIRAVDVELLLRDVDAARAWLEEHLARFPADRDALERFEGRTETTGLG